MDLWEKGQAGKKGTWLQARLKNFSLHELNIRSTFEKDLGHTKPNETHLDTFCLRNIEIVSSRPNISKNNFKKLIVNTVQSAISTASGSNKIVPIGCVLI